MVNWLKRSRRRIGWLIALASVLLLIVFSWKGMYAKKPVYLTSTVIRADLEHSVLATGVLQAIKQVDVGAQVSGQLKSLKVEIGDQVKKGQLLAQIDPTLLKNDSLLAQAAQHSLEAQQSAARARLEEATVLFRRQKILLPRRATSQQEYDRAKMNVQVQHAELKALEAQIRQAKIKAESALANLAYTRILAPMDGEVVGISTLEGQTVIAAQMAPTIVKLADLSVMTVKVQVSEADVIRIYPGQVVYFTILGEPTKRYYGKLRTVQPSPEKINNAIFYPALFDVPNPDNQLRLDMTAQVSIVLNDIKNTLVIPAMALGDQRPDGRYDVRVLNPDHSVSVRQVKIGAQNNVQAQVLEGLKEKDVVITSQPTVPAGGGAK